MDQLLEEKLLIGLAQAETENNALGRLFSVGQILNIDPMECRNIAEKESNDGYIIIPQGLSQVPKVSLTDKGREYASKLIAEAEKLQ